MTSDSNNEKKYSDTTENVVHDKLSLLNTIDEDTIIQVTLFQDMTSSSNNKKEYSDAIKNVVGNDKINDKSDESINNVYDNLLAGSISIQIDWTHNLSSIINKDIATQVTLFQDVAIDNASIQTDG
ncbi:hypothetical protein RhiirA4_485339 [Rhizophagus irregularis]|uniref:Uncharacterized protein n=1 Tax=Rhizophagus irregularis TaxID=588596 RepID=A0A2I1HQ25_9GLOM|nr:hypothetical protein RhiirA4_485339 [Rhizophagus irregularis]